MYISKSDYQVGRRCPKRLWHEKHRQWIAKRSANDEKNTFEGNRFNDAVHEHFSDGIMIGWEHGLIEEAAERYCQVNLPYLIELANEHIQAP